MEKQKVDGLQGSLKLLVKTSMIVFIGVVISKILGYTHRIIIARYFGPEAYGLFTLALTVVSFFSVIATFGLNDGLLRFIPLLRAKSKTNELNYLFRFVIKSFIISGAIATAILFFMSDYIAISIFHNPNLAILLKIFSAMVIFALINGVFLTVLRGFEEIASYSFAFNILQNVFKVGALVVFILIGFSSGASPIVISFIVGIIATLIASYFLVRIKLAPMLIGYDHSKDYSKIRKEFLDYSLPVMFYSIVGMIFYWIDSLSLGIFKSATDVGIYNAAVPIALLLAFVPELFMQLFFPMINREYSNKNRELIEQLSKQVTKWIFMAILPIFVLLFLFPGTALNVLFGAQYLPASTALRLLLIGAFFSAIGTVSNNLVSMAGKSKILLMNIVSAAIVNVILNMLLIPQPYIAGIANPDGLVGAASATLVSIIFINILLFAENKIYLSFIPLRRKMLTIFLMALLAVAALFYVKGLVQINMVSVIILSCCFTLIYLMLIIISGALDKNDWAIIKAILRKIFHKKE